MQFSISVEAYRGSAISSLLSVVLVDIIMRDIRKPAPWTLLHADDVMLVCEDSVISSTKWKLGATA